MNKRKSKSAAGKPIRQWWNKREREIVRAVKLAGVLSDNNVKAMQAAADEVMRRFWSVLSPDQQETFADMQSNWQLPMKPVGHDLLATINTVGGNLKLYSGKPPETADVTHTVDYGAISERTAAYITQKMLRHAQAYSMGGLAFRDKLVKAYGKTVTFRRYEVGSNAGFSYIHSEAKEFLHPHDKQQRQRMEFINRDKFGSKR